MEYTESIPPLIHQTWKTHTLPPEWKQLAQTWTDHHPTWKYRLWTDDDNQRFIAQHYPWFLPIYEGYDEQIKRVDACRYFVLHHYGGLYVDLDFQCLRALDDLLRGKELVLGLEPRAHAAEPQVRSRGIDQIVCNAFMASVPGHPF